MKAVIFDRDAQDFKLVEMDVPTVTGFDVLIKVAACGLNPVDAKISLWQSMIADQSGDWITGLDVVGEVVACGEQVTEWSKGDKVFCHGNMLRQYGGFAEYSLQDSRHLLSMPQCIAAEAAALPCAGWTAWRALVDKLNIHQQRASILITGGSGGVGSFAIQIAKYFKVPQIITTCSGKNVDFVQQLGATEVIDYQNTDVVTEVKKLTAGKGVEVGLDTVGGDNDIAVANSLAFEGEMVELVQLVRPELYQDSFLAGLSFHQLSLGSGLRYGDAARVNLLAAAAAFNAAFEYGSIKVPKLQTITLEQVPETLRQMLQQRTVGKLVVCL